MVVTSPTKDPGIPTVLNLADQLPVFTGAPGTLTWWSDQTDRKICPPLLTPSMVASDPDEVVMALVSASTPFGT